MSLRSTMKELVKISGRGIDIEFPTENVKIKFNIAADMYYGNWLRFNSAIDDNVSGKIACKYRDLSYEFRHDNGNVTIYINAHAEFGIALKIPISLSSSNRHVLKQVEQAFKCVDSGTVYEWIDIPVPMKSSRNV